MIGRTVHPILCNLRPRNNFQVLQLLPKFLHRTLVSFVVVEHERFWVPYSLRFLRHALQPRRQRRNIFSLAFFYNCDEVEIMMAGSFGDALSFRRLDACFSLFSAQFFIFSLPKCESRVKCVQVQSYLAFSLLRRALVGISLGRPSNTRRLPSRCHGLRFLLLHLVLRLNRLRSCLRCCFRLDGNT